MSTPSLVITQSRTKLAAWLVLFAATSAAFVFTAWLSTFLRDVLWAYLGVAVAMPIGAAFAFAAILTAASLARPATLSADQNGLHHCTYRQTRTHRWEQIEDFIVFESSNRLRSPGCVLIQGSPGRRYFSFGRAWENSPEAVVQMLKDARDRLYRPASRPRSSVGSPSPQERSSPD